MAEDVDLAIDGQPLEMVLGDGSVIRPHVGVNPIAADAQNEWLYFGPMHSTSLYRVRTESLRDASLSVEQLASQVERFSDKPITDGISMDRAGNIYLGDLAKHGVVRIAPDGSSTTVAQDPQLSWVDAFSFGPDGKLYGVANQLHLTAPLHRGEDATVPPFLIVAFPADSAGIVGR